MSKLKNKKFYRGGKLPVKGTKITLKTQPYLNGVVFNTEDPISSFHCYLILLKNIVNNYELIKDIPGLDIKNEISNIDIGYVKLLLDFLIQSPIEITLKEQIIDNNLIMDTMINGVE